MTLEKYYSLREVEEIVGATRRTVYTWIKSGTLEAQKIGSQWRVPETALNAFINKNRAAKQ